MNTREKAEVMIAFADGEEIQGAPLCVPEENRTYMNMSDPCWNWRTTIYRKKPKPKLRPYTFEELKELRGQSVCFISSKGKIIRLIVCVEKRSLRGEPSVGLGNVPKNFIIGASGLLKNYIHVDGSPCGVQENK